MTRVIFTTLAVLAGCASFTGSAQAHPPWSITLDRHGQIYFSDLETIWKIDTQGKLSVVRPGVHGRHTHELTINADGNLYGEDIWYEPATKRFFCALWKITPAGEFAYLVAPTDSPPKGMSIWRDNAGNTYSVALPGDLRETLLVKRTPDGKLIALSGDSAAVDKWKPHALHSEGMTFAPDGSLYVRTRKDTRKVTMDGAVTLAPHTAVGFAFDAQGNLFGADYPGRRVIKTTPDGKATVLLRSPSPWRPSAVALQGGDIYVLEFRMPFMGKLDGVRVLKRSSDGTVTVLAALKDGREVPAQMSLTDTDNWNAVRAEKNVLYQIGGSVLMLTATVWYLYKKFQHQQP